MIALRKHKLLIFLLLLDILFGFLIYTKFGLITQNGDALYDAQVARNLVEGKGFSTSILPLSGLSLFKELGIDLTNDWVAAHRFVLPIIIKYFLFVIFGTNLFAANFLYSYTFHLLSLVIVYFLAYKLLDNEKKAALAVFLFITNPVINSNYLTTSGINIQADIFFFLSLVLIFLKFIENEKNIWLFSSGLITGFAILNRYNSVIYIAVILATLIYITYRKREKLLTFLKKLSIRLAIYLSGVLLILSPLLLYFYIKTGHFFVSVNSMQLFIITPMVSFVDIWFKLEYPFIFMGEKLPLILGYLPELFYKWKSFFFLTIKEFISFINLWFLSVLFFIYILLNYFFRKEFKKINFVLSFFFGAVFALQIVLLPFYGAYSTYYFYLFPLLMIPIAEALFILNARIQNTPVLRAWQVFKESYIATKIFLILIFGGVIIFIFCLLSALEPTILNYIKIPYLYIYLALLFLFFANPRLLKFLFLFSLIVLFFQRINFFIPFNETETYQTRWDMDTHADDLKTFEELRDGVVLSISPWNLAWHNNLKSLPLPEYPDQIYVLEREYNQKINGIYLNSNKILGYPSPCVPYVYQCVPYQWNGYVRAAQYGYNFEGFTNVLEKDGRLIMIKKSDFTPEDIETREIDFGKAESSSHLIWGWGEDKYDASLDFSFATKIKKDDEFYKRLNLFPIVSSTDTVIPDAELTFINYGGSLKNIELRVKSFIGGQTIKVFLNSNLLSIGEPGVYLGEYSILERDQWLNINIGIPAGMTRRGMNKLSFKFLKSDENNNFLAFDYLKLK